MKRKEQKEKSKSQILQAALIEFSKKAYDGASVTTICERNSLSKGRVYHYFKGKDDIFLACVAECFNEFSKFLSQNVIFDKNDIRKTIGNYFSARYIFFSKFPDLKNIFFIATLNPPPHLAKKINELYSELKSINDNFINCVLKYLPIRNPLDKEDINEYLSAFETFFYAYFNQKLLNAKDDINPLDLLDKYGRNAMDLLLYGVALQDEISS